MALISVMLHFFFVVLYIKNLSPLITHHASENDDSLHIAEIKILGAPNGLGFEVSVSPALSSKENLNIKNGGFMDAQVKQDRVDLPPGIKEETNPVLFPPKNDASPFVLPTPYYYSSHELSKKPKVIKDIPPDFQVDAHSIPLEPISLTLFINEAGHVDKVEVTNEHLFSDVKELLINAFLQTRFSPGEINGDPVKSQLRIVLTVEDFASFFPLVIPQ